jgi:SAM-dependent methyltransferase
VEFNNVYGDSQRAEAYARLEFPGTYSLAYRDIPGLISGHVKGTRALDFGCGTGRSTRFLKALGFHATGIDISKDMLKQACELDPEGEYYLVEDGSLSPVQSEAYDLVLSAFTFDNIPTMEKKVSLFNQLREMLIDEGKILSLVSSPEIYTHEWASFSTRDFPENRDARSGDKVKIVMTDVEDRRPVEDIIWSEEGYAIVYRQAGLEIAQKCKPLAKASEPYQWVNETTIAPWTIYVLKKHIQQ